MIRSNLTYTSGLYPIVALCALWLPSVSLADDAAEEASTEIEIYGHAMLDMGYQTKQNDPDWFDVVRPTKLPSFEDEFGDDGTFFSGVRQSRLGVKTSTPTSIGELKTIFEFELFGVGGDAGETTFRLRHAWGEIGQFGAGQYWSVFMDIDVFPNSIEYWGPTGMVFYRNVQARWTPWQTSSGSRFAISIERPGASGDAGRFEDRVELDGVEGDFEVPDIAAHVRWAGDWGHLQVAGILRQIEWNDLNDDAIDLSGSETGWGLNVSTNIRFGPHVLRGSVVYGEGIQNYLNDASSDIGVRTNFGNPALPIRGEAIPLTAITAFLDLNWSDKWTSTVGFSIQDNDLPNGQNDDTFAEGTYALANLLYHPAPNVMVGTELQWAERDNFRDGFSSDDFRVQFSAKYSFSASLLGR
ncbi:MAG: DcaP family trimeric outer membrane transporter [Woeseiaceae bacterium]